MATMETLKDEERDSMHDEESGRATEPNVVPRVEFSERPTLMGQGQSKKHRRSVSHDLATGKEGGAREVFVAKIRPTEDCVARKRRNLVKSPKLGRMVTSARSKIRWSDNVSDDDDNDVEDAPVSIHGRLRVQQSRMLVGAGNKNEDEDDNDKTKKAARPMAQYRLSAPKEKLGFWGSLVRCCGLSGGRHGIYDHAGGNDSSCSCFGIQPNMIIVNFLNWSFRNNLFMVFLSGACGFFTLTILFATFILGIGRNRPLCITVNGNYFNGTAADFSDAFALSWTTFSTVGYGLIYPSTSASWLDATRTECAGIQALCTLESFVGILFASFCGAVMFAKVARIRSHAQVIFSDPMVVRYGHGVLVNDDDERSSATSGRANELDAALDRGKWKAHHLPPPVLEFRIVNRLNGVDGGEIMDGTLNLVAIIDEKQGGHIVRRVTRTRRRKGKRRARKRRSVEIRRESYSAASIPENSISEDRDDHRSSLSTQPFPSIATLPTVNQEFDEDPSGRLVPKRIFSKIEVETPDHPFFKRAWLVRHVLDENSPLLTSEVRRMVKQNRGHWPDDLNNHEAVRRSVRFDQLLVSMSGTSNADASSVYAQHVYEYVDMNVGYRFVNILYRGQDGSLLVDQSMVNDVVEQYGGGAEPFAESTGETRRSEILV